jgi:hypothetical protein
LSPWVDEPFDVLPLCLFAYVAGDRPPGRGKDGKHARLPSDEAECAADAGRRDPEIGLHVVDVERAALGTFLLSSAESFAIGALAGMCIGFGMGDESDVTPYVFSRYFGLRSLSTLYGFTWMATGIAGGPWGH